MLLDGFVLRANEILHEYEEPRKYLYSRGFQDSDIDKYGIGYVRFAKIKEDGSEDCKALKEATYGFKTLQKKIILPLKNVLGKVHGLCTRDLVEKRYTQYFLSEAKKIGCFFGLHEALPSIRQTGIVFVHEGAFDSISFARVFPNTVSSLTSFLNQQQYEILRFYADKIVLVFDKDKAGNIGVRKTIYSYDRKHIDSFFLGDDDANTYLRMLGMSRFESYLRSKIPRYLQKKY